MRPWLLRGTIGFWTTVALAGCPGDDVTQTDDDSDTGTAPTTSGVTMASTDDGPGATSVVGDTTTTGPMPTSDSSGPPPGDSSSDGGPPPTCGNNILEGDEVCDLAQLSGETCQSLGYQGGTLGCLLNCTDYNLLGCFICGNGTVDMAEECEGEVPMGVTCESLGYEAGDVTCGDDCLFDVSECSLCGDGIEQGPEDCDGLDLDGQTCMSLGFDMGTLSCNIPTCSYDYSGCSGGMYIQTFEAGVMPAEFTVDAASPWTVSNMMPITGTWSARSGMFPIGVGGITNLTLQASFPVAGNVAFMHNESTAAGADFLEFYVDGVFQQSWSGINVAAMYSQPVAAGVHTFQWRFNRAGFIDAGSNAVFVDDITLTGGVPI